MIPTTTAISTSNIQQPYFNLFHNRPEDPTTMNKVAKRKRGKKMIPISIEQLEANFHYPQPEAAKRLGVSVSTLKRRFYEVHGGSMRWPYSDRKRTTTTKRNTIAYILNKDEKPATYLDNQTLFHLHMVFSKYSSFL